LTKKCSLGLLFPTIFKAGEAAGAEDGMGNQIVRGIFQQHFLGW